MQGNARGTPKKSNHLTLSIPLSLSQKESNARCLFLSNAVCSTTPSVSENAGKIYGEKGERDGNYMATIANPPRS
jgi:hypothetical protein